MFAKKGTEAQEQNGGPVGLDRQIDALENRRDSKEERRVANELKGQRARGWFEKLLTRTLSGVIYVVVIVGCLFWGIVPTAVLLSLMGWVCCSEFFRISRMAGRRPNEILGLTVAIAYPLVATFFLPRMLIVATAMFEIMVGAWYVFTPRANISDVAVTVFGPIYTSLSLVGLTMIRTQIPGMDGAWMALVAIGAIWAEDSLAYLVGSTLGRHKMAPRISPNKSWEGFFGGLVGSVAVWAAAACFNLAGITWPVALAAGLIEGVVAVIGDLFESRIKRGVGVKDSGNLIPGHGGLLDRTDSMLFGSVIAYFILVVGGIL